jgi:AraC-like DNA-binding protein
MTQIVKFPDKPWAKLATIAERRGITIAELLVETAEAAITGKPPAPAPVVVQPAPPVPHAPKPKRQVSPVIDTDDPEIAGHIREMRAQNWSVLRIAREMGATRDAVRGAFTRLGLTAVRGGRPVTPIDLDRVAALHAQNRSDGEIAQELGVTYAVAYRARRTTLGLPSVGRSGRKTTTNQETTA